MYQIPRIVAHPARFVTGMLIFLFAFVALPATQAAAQEAEAWGELGLHAHNQQDGPGVIVISPLVTGYYNLTDAIYGELTVGASGLVYLEDDEDDELTGDDDFDVHVGNPYLGVGFLIDTPGMDIHIITGVAVPVAVPEGIVSYTFAEGIRGRRDAWLWAPRRLSPVIGLQFSQQVNPNVRIGAEAKASAMFWMGDGSQDILFPFQIAGEAAMLATEDLEFGVRALGVGGEPLYFGADYRFQVSGELFGRLDTENQTYQARLTVPINEPYGFGFAPDGFWGLHIGAGMRF